MHGKLPSFKNIIFLFLIMHMYCTTAAHTSALTCENYDIKEMVLLKM